MKVYVTLDPNIISKENDKIPVKMDNANVGTIIDLKLINGNIKATLEITDQKAIDKIHNASINKATLSIDKMNIY